MSTFTTDLERARRAVSPRYAPPPTPLSAVIIHGGVTLLWILLFLQAFGAGGVFAWSVGLAYIGYDTALLLFVFWQTLPLLRAAGPEAKAAAADRISLGVIVAAYNEAAVLPQTLAALLAQTEPPDEVVIADDGSDDGTAELLSRYGLVQPALGEISGPGPLYPTLRWLRLRRGGKARALNEALGCIGSEVVLTVDADTVPDPEAIAAMRRAFAAEPELVAATGVLFPVCPVSPGGRVFQWFQTYEYMRNFLSRYAWARQDGLLLISGAFAAYELTHRLRHHAAAQGLRWSTDVIGSARARTDAPATISAFLRQRQRWFGGFLQTQLWYRHMIGDQRYGRLGTRMLPVKAFDTMQPLYGLTSIGLLLAYGLAGHVSVVGPVALIIGGKIGLDVLFCLWSLLLYRRWAGPAVRIDLFSAVAAALIEPFSFQVLRHSGAALGWVSFMTGQRRWGSQARTRAAAPL
ncbi:MAG: glycosyltransferase [Rhodopila sp.]